MTRNRIMFILICAVTVMITLFAVVYAEDNSKVSVPVFSAPAGFYDGEFELKISCNEGESIYYTTDSSDPKTSNTAQLYDEPLYIYNNNRDRNIWSTKSRTSLHGTFMPRVTVQKGIVIRCACRNKDGVWGDEVINTYFVNKNESYFSTMGVISLVTDGDNLFDPETGIYMIGNMFERWMNSDDYVDYGFVADTRNPCNYNQRGREWERPCNIQVFRNGKLEFSQDVGMRISGNFSRCMPQKSITLYARRAYSEPKMKYDYFIGNCLDFNSGIIRKFDKVTLRNGGSDLTHARYRDDLMAYLCRNMYVSTMTKADYILFINGEFWGYYSLQEKMDDEYIESHYGVEAENVTCIKNGKVEGSTERYDEYIEFYDWLMGTDLSVPENYAVFASKVEVISLIDYIAAESYINNYDFGENINNWMIWRATTPEGNGFSDGRWRFMLFDTDFSLGLNSMDSTGYNGNFFDVMNTDPAKYAIPALFEKAIENETFASAFYNRCIEVIDTVFLPEIVIPLVDEYEEKIMDAFEDTCGRFNMKSDVESESNIIRSYFQRRPGYAKQFVQELCERNGAELSEKTKTEYANDDWHFETENAGVATAEYTDPCCVMINVSSPDKGKNHARYIGRASLEKNRIYCFSYEVSTDGKYAVCVRDKHDNVFYYREFCSEAEEKEQSIWFDMQEDCEDAEIIIICGFETGNYKFSNMQLKEY